MNKDTKKVVDSSKQDQLTMVDDIVIGNSELGNKRIVLTTMIINTICVVRYFIIMGHYISPIYSR